MSEGFGDALPGGVHAAWAARRAIAANDRTLPPSVRDDGSLLVTELVTNAVRHGGARNDRTLHLKFRRRTDGIRVEVVDPGTGFGPRPTPPNGDSSGGWGVFRVDRIAERLGVRPAQPGTCVWFELPAGLTV
jgi:serine/threonine-protein kinase RsbW